MLDSRVLRACALYLLGSTLSPWIHAASKHCLKPPLNYSNVCYWSAGGNITKAVITAIWMGDPDEKMSVNVEYGSNTGQRKSVSWGSVKAPGKMEHTPRGGPWQSMRFEVTYPGFVNNTTFVYICTVPHDCVESIPR